MATNKGYAAYEQEDSDDDDMLIVEERNLLDDDVFGNEANEPELENDEGVNGDDIEEALSEADEATTSDNVVEFLPLEKAKSAVWRYFGFPASSGEYVEKDKRRRKEVFCTLCKNPLNYTGSTTNMIVHLQYRHLAEFNELVLLQKQKSSEQPKRTPLPKGQQSIEESFGKTMPLAHNSTRWKTLTNAVCQFLAKDLVPIDTVNDPGFRSMLKVFEPRYTIPDRTTFSRHYLPSLYQKQKAIISEQMASGLKDFAITTDCWTSRAHHSFMSLTVHYISIEWKLQSHLLETGEITVEHTAINLSSYLEECLERWNLQSAQVSAVVTDNASNITAAINRLEWLHFGCFSHTLQLGVQKAISLTDVSKAFGRARKLVGHFHSSVKSTNILRQKQQDLRHDQHKLIQVL